MRLKTGERYEEKKGIEEKKKRRERKVDDEIQIKRKRTTR